MAVFRRLLCAALCAGLIAGLFAAVAHEIGTVPLILQAETYEEAARAASSGRGHDHAAAAEHDHLAAAEWKPETPIERAAYTAAADLLAAIGFALVLAAGLSLRGAEGGWREGLYWGLAGFAVFTLAPGLGLPPEIPGSAAAPLVERQVWWLATVAATAAGLALLAFTRRPATALLGAVLIVLPHLYGAPQPLAETAAAPAELARRFVIAATLVSFLFWAALGAATGYFYRRFEPRRS